MVVMVIYAGTTAGRNVNIVENQSEYQNIDQSAHDVLVAQEQPFLIGVGALETLFVFVLILAGIGFFINLIVRGRYGRDL